MVPAAQTSSYAATATSSFSVQQEQSFCWPPVASSSRSPCSTTASPSTTAAELLNLLHAVLLKNPVRDSTLQLQQQHHHWPLSRPTLCHSASSTSPIPSTNYLYTAAAITPEGSSDTSYSSDVSTPKPDYGISAAVDYATAFYDKSCAASIFPSPSAQDLSPYTKYRHSRFTTYITFS